MQGDRIRLGEPERQRAGPAVACWLEGRRQAWALVQPSSWVSVSETLPHPLPPSLATEAPEAPKALTPSPGHGQGPDLGVRPAGGATLGRYCVLALCQASSMCETLPTMRAALFVPLRRNKQRPLGYSPWGSSCTEQAGLGLEPVLSAPEPGLCPQPALTGPPMAGDSCSKTLMVRPSESQRAGWAHNDAETRQGRQPRGRTIEPLSTGTATGAPPWAHSHRRTTVRGCGDWTGSRVPGRHGRCPSRCRPEASTVLPCTDP